MVIQRLYGNTRGEIVERKMNETKNMKEKKMLAMQALKRLIGSIDIWYPN
jgi:hypothetical protein